MCCSPSGLGLCDTCLMVLPCWPGEHTPPVPTLDFRRMCCSPSGLVLCGTCLMVLPRWPGEHTPPVQTV
ncbi:unnamed protein product [Strongylus vulgaris]|uniref:Uncharacterized protein n=1 Tax=Strongylus vulgaris TaxID=40348 RepID=A0A3P7J8F5_STRVU|nr:unnamed protein product [Strongylus vulgaris]